MSGLRRFTLLLGVMVLTQLHGIAAGDQGGRQALGFITARGSVWVDQQPAASRTALFAGDVVSTGEASTAVMTLGSGSAATLSENGEVVLLPRSDAGQLSLRRGKLVVRSEVGQVARVVLPVGSVLIRGEGGFPALCRIAFAGGSGIVLAERGRVEVQGRGRRVIVPAGKQVRLEAGSPQAAGQQAGSVSNAIPDEVIQRQGKGAEIALKVADRVDWEDVVRTLKTGRVRIALQEGSFLNVGARSTMRILRHDPQTQQTQVELTLGRLRGEVVKVTKPGGRFEVRTQTAVIGVVGTVFVIEALRNLTRVWVIDGLVQVTNLNAAIVGTITMGAGQFTSVPVAAPPSPPVVAPTSQVVQQAGQTSTGEQLSSEVTQGLQKVGATPSQVAQAGQAVTTAAAQAGATAANVVSAASGAASAGLSGAALGNVNEAIDTLETAEATLDDAVELNDEAAGDAIEAGEIVDEIGDIVDEILSPTTPCGCVE